MKNFAQLQGLLFDLDGVLYVGSVPVTGAIEAINTLQNSGLVCRFITNTSTLSLQSLQDKINALGFDIPLTEIISAPQAALHILKHSMTQFAAFYWRMTLNKILQCLSNRIPRRNLLWWAILAMRGHTKC